MIDSHLFKSPSHLGQTVNCAFFREHCFFQPLNQLELPGYLLPGHNISLLHQIPARCQHEDIDQLPRASPSIRRAASLQSWPLASPGPATACPLISPRSILPCRSSPFGKEGLYCTAAKAVIAHLAPAALLVLIHETYLIYTRFICHQAKHTSIIL
jgi:hypothetical protein